MFQRALIAVDLNSSADLLRCAPDLKQWGTVSLTLLHLVKSGYGEGQVPGLLDEYRQTLETSGNELRDMGFDVDVIAASVSDIGDGIVEISPDYDLIVAGTRSMNLVEEIFLGSAVRTVLRESNVPVLLQQIAAPGESDEMAQLQPTDTLRHILLATDLAHGSTAAHEAAEVLAARGALVDCAHVMESDELTDYPERKTMLDAALQQAVKRAGGRGEALLKSGEPVQLLLELAAERSASMMVVGRTGRKWPQTLLGSTARKLCEQSGLPVLVVPRSEK